MFSLLLVILGLVLLLGGSIGLISWAGSDESFGRTAVIENDRFVEYRYVGAVKWFKWMQAPLVAFGLIGLIASVVALPALCIAWPVNYFTSMEAVQGLRGFRETVPVYQETIENARTAMLEGSVRGDIDLAYNQQVTAYIDAMRDYQAQVDWYNRELSRNRRLAETPIVGWMRVGVGDLEPITEH
jgi:hypothetical protein